LLGLSFNPRIGIHFVRTSCPKPSWCRSAAFQSPHRDSLRSHIERRGGGIFTASSFNPRIGIHFVRTPGPPSPRRLEQSFNPRIGIHFVRTPHVPISYQGRGRFNPRIGIHFVRTI